MQAILDAGSEVITPEPFYPNYETCALIAGGALRPIMTRPENGYRYATREQIEPLINKKTRAIMLANPSNPTGYILSPEEMRLLADIAIENDLYLIADEVYREFAYGERMPESFSKFKDLEQHLVLVDSASKRFSACGARIGALLTKNEALMAQMMKLAQCRLSVATLDQIATTALYQLDPGYFDEVREEYHRRRDICYKKLMEIPGVCCECPEGAFYMMAKLPVDDTEKFQKWLLEEFEDNGETVMFAPGIGFYTTPGCGTQEIRIAYVLEGHKLERAMELLGLSESAARELLMQLTAEGQLTRDHPVYRPVGAETTAAQRESRIRAVLAEHGPCSARELSERLGMAPRMIQRALEPMLARGEIAKEVDMSRPGHPLSYTLIHP